MQLFSLVGFTILVLLTGFPSIHFLQNGNGSVFLVIAAGILNVFGLMQLYRAFSVGNMSLAAPIAGSFPIFTILLAFIVLGQTIGLEKGIAISIVISGVIMTGISPETEHVQIGKKSNSNTVASALIASFFFGAAYLCLDAGLGYLGAVISIWFVRLGAVIFAFPFLLLTTKKFVRPRGETWKWLIAMTLLDSSGFAALTLGYVYSGSSTAIVTTLSSLLGAVTTILAAVIYKDRLTRIQIVGIVVLFLGVIVVLNV